MGDFPVTVSLQAVKGDIEGLRKEVQDQFNSPINVKFNMGELGKASGVKSTTTGLVGIASQLNRCRVNLNSLNGAQKINSLDMKKATAVMKTYGQYYDVSAKKSKAETSEITRQAAALRLSNAQRLQGQRLITEGNAARDKAYKTEASFIRLQNQARSFYTKNQANISDKGGDATWKSSISKYGDATQWVSAAEAQNAYAKQQRDWVEQGVTGQTKVNKTLLTARELTDFSKLEDQARDYYNTNYKNINKNAVLSARWQNQMSKMQDPTKYGATEAERIGNARSELASLRTESERAGVSIESVGQRLNRLFGAHLNTALVMAALHGLQQAVVAVYQNVVGLDKATVDLQIASGKSRTEVQGMVRGYSQTAKALGATTLEVAQGADSWLRQNMSIADSNTMVTNTMMLSKLGQIDSTAAAKNLTSAMKGYNVTVEDSVGIVDKLTAVDMVSASDAGSLATSMSETAVGARLAGVSMDKLIGQIAVVSEVTQDKLLSHYIAMCNANPLNCWKPLTSRRGQSAAKLFKREGSTAIPRGSTRKRVEVVGI